MKTVFARIVLGANLCLVLAASHASAQGFINLNFESPIPPFVPDISGHVPITNTMPGWIAYQGGTAVDWTLYNNISLGAPAVSLQSSTSPWPAIQGNYSALLQASFPGQSVLAGIGQVGSIPSDAKSVLYYCKPYERSAIVSFAGQSLPLAILGGSLDTFLILGGDISAFAGQTGELRFTGGGWLDNIQFSNQPIPEPSAFSLFGLGALLLGWRIRHRVK